MSKDIQHDLCKGLRACGIPKEQTHQLTNIVMKWYQSSGPEWTVNRLKALRQWYETVLTGNPVPPAWFRKSKDGYPTGIWKWVFNLPTGKALGVLSMGTCFYATRENPKYHKKVITESQVEKFYKGIHGGNPKRAEGRDAIKRILSNPDIAACAEQRFLLNAIPHKFLDGMPDIPLPTIWDMNGSVPIHSGQEAVYPQGSLGRSLQALEDSWDSIPQVTFDFLDQQDLLGLMPMKVLGNEYQLELDRPRSSTVGRIGVIQEPEMKARIIANPNRVTQVTLDPLQALYQGVARKLPTDCTHQQSDGVHWVQAKLKQGLELAGSDMTSASDLLDLESCLDLIECFIPLCEVPGYEDHRDYFLQVSRSDWYCPFSDEKVQWTTGFPLGTGPSFGVLTLANNAMAILASLEAASEGSLSITEIQDLSDMFRVIGDDIIMDARIEPYYTRWVERCGGEINHSKTLKSDRVAEFAGHIITPTRDYVKRVKYKEPSDNNFMSYIAQLGDQAKGMLRPKQRRVYNLLKEVPGVVVDGPWMQDSYGVRLSDRYQWYLEEVLPQLSREEPDLKLQRFDVAMLNAWLDAEEAGIAVDLDLVESMFTDSGYQPEEVTGSWRHSNDPRLNEKGETFLRAMMKHVENGLIVPFTTWYEAQQERSTSIEEIDWTDEER